MTVLHEERAHFLEDGVTQLAELQVARFRDDLLQNRHRLRQLGQLGDHRLVQLAAGVGGVRDGGVGDGGRVGPRDGGVLNRRGLRRRLVLLQRTEQLGNVFPAVLLVHGHVVEEVVAEQRGLLFLVLARRAVRHHRQGGQGALQRTRYVTDDALEALRLRTHLRRFENERRRARGEFVERVENGVRRRGVHEEEELVERQRRHGDGGGAEQRVQRLGRQGRDVRVGERLLIEEVLQRYSSVNPKIGTIIVGEDLNDAGSES